jgi:hypothetical protein
VNGAEREKEWKNAIDAAEEMDEKLEVATWME